MSNYIVPIGINLEAWEEWVEYRSKGKKKKVTEFAARKQFKMLLEYSEPDQQKVIDQSIMNDYQGLFELKGNTNGQQIQFGRNASGRKLTPTERVQAKRAEAAQRRNGVESVGNDDHAVSSSMDEQRGGGTNGNLGATIDGTFTRSN